MSNPLGKGTRNLSANVPIELFVAIESLANVSGVSMGAYVRALMEDARAKRTVVRENPDDKAAWLSAVREGAKPLPKVRVEVAPEQPIVSLRAAEDAPGERKKA